MRHLLTSAALAAALLLPHAEARAQGSQTQFCDNTITATVLSRPSSGNITYQLMLQYNPVPGTPAVNAVSRVSVQFIPAEGLTAEQPGNWTLVMTGMDRTKAIDVARAAFTPPNRPPQGTAVMQQLRITCS